MVSSSNDGENDLDYEDNDFRRDSDEDTEDASETEAEKKDEEFTGIKDQMFHDQLQQYKRQLHQLKNGTLPTYVKKLKKLEMLHGDRLHMNTLLSDIQMKIIEEEFKKEKLAAAKEFEDRKLELRDTLINELEHKKKTIELERQSMELTGDTMLVKPVTTRKLRRRPNDPAPVPEKRSKPSPVQLSNSLDDDLINDDLSYLCKFSNINNNNMNANNSSSSKSHNTNNNISTILHMNSTQQHQQHQQQHQQHNLDSMHSSLHEVFVQDSRLCIDKRWHNKDQPISVDSKEHGKFNGNIININHDEIVIKRVSDNVKVKLGISQLQKGLCSIKKRT